MGNRFETGDVCNAIVKGVVEETKKCGGKQAFNATKEFVDSGMLNNPIVSKLSYS